ncbi:tRNA dimethylallyltransferase [Ruminococcus sp. YE71]|uniref:tRNA (adenosine(37)-N6)-dimethylallyltransferase MiaA n=1 Tax=unclassified Ruminococcus TaxID=2608920 RepID=UPI000885119B|nr:MULTISPECIES: tRNA (adenosine(37)-N6)-dimethylallyltransferase MiaA [unclassified Ruminococcus]SDA13680.1 tRNA dimethylallyltransferase [Ruminococcus sp. YE78]SFW19489.1 tRNA dimethylallyltransferase [Ruminococcus sp. YE71]
MAERKIPLLVIGGPTASGKTALSVELAKKLGGEVVCADSMQVYKDFQIITARVTEEEMQGVPHHLTGFLPLEKSFSVAEWADMARACIADIHSRGKLPIVCGGTGLYISTLLDNIVFEDRGADPERRGQLEKFAEENGRHALWEKLSALDPEAAAEIHENNVKRVVRAIEVCESTGRGFYEQRRQNLKGDSPYDAFVLTIGFEDRGDLYDRVNRRVGVMLEEGMVDEARRVYENSDPATAYQAIGYKELIPYLRGEKPLEECAENIRLGTRHYAKRQLTWFRRIDGITTVFFPKDGDNKIFYENVEKSIAKSVFLCYNKR